MYDRASTSWLIVKIWHIVDDRHMSAESKLSLIRSALLALWH